MKAGCYTLDLYCDSDRKQPNWYEFPRQYTGRSERECIQQARQDGWRIGEDKDICPLCTGAITEKEAKKRYYGGKR